MLNVLLYPLSLLYGLIIYIRNKLFDLKILKSTVFDIPIISVGNITVGGTGKTPHAEYLISLLSKNNKLATLSRGYKRKTKGYILADKFSSVNQIGDEPAQIKRKFPNVYVAVDEKRVRGIQNLESQIKDLDLVILDDAYQHRYVKPGLSILLVDYNRPVYKDHLLPYGRLRETVFEMRRAHIIIVTKVPDAIKPIEQRIIRNDYKLYPYQLLLFTTLKYDTITSVFNMKSKYFDPLTDTLSQASVLLVTGISQPKSLLNYINKHAKSFHHMNFADHHTYTKKNIELIYADYKKINDDKKLILTTEKDAVKFFDMEEHCSTIKNDLFYLPLKVEFLGDDKQKFDNRIERYVKRSKRDSKVPHLIY